MGKHARGMFWDRLATGLIEQQNQAKTMWLQIINKNYKAELKQTFSKLKNKLTAYHNSGSVKLPDFSVVIETNIQLIKKIP